MSISSDRGRPLPRLGTRDLRLQLLSVSLSLCPPLAPPVGPLSSSTNLLLAFLLFVFTLSAKEGLEEEEVQYCRLGKIKIVRAED